VLIGLVGVALYAFQVGKLSKTILLVLSGLLIVGDLWLVDKRYLRDEKFQRNPMRQALTKTPADERILQDESHYRVLALSGNTFQEARTSYFHKSLGGYFSAKLRRYQDLIERKLSQEQQQLIRGLQEGDTTFFVFEGGTRKLNPPTPTINMLNTKYIKFGTQENAVLENAGALGNAWFVSEVSTVSSPDEEMAALGTFDPARVAVVDQEKFPLETTTFIVDSAASVGLTDYSPRDLTYQTQNANEGLLVFSEIYYPEGWQITVDGEPAEMIRVNYVLRALPLSPGEHTIHFTFQPDSFVKGGKISQIAVYLVFITSLLALGMAFYQKTRS
jgi:hypothetical protein